MKKRTLAFILLVASILSFTACGSGGSDIGISQEEYDSVKRQYEDLQSDYSKLQDEYKAVKADLDAANKQVENLLAEIEEASKVVDPEPASVDVFVYDDDYVEIHFIGCELDRDKQQLVFMVTNKTDWELTFQSNTMAIDGMSLGHVSGSDSIAAQSKGKIRFKTKEDFPTMVPETISGTIKVIDFEKALWGSQSYDVPFSNLDVAP